MDETMPKITYSQLGSILQDVGFTRSVIPGSHVLFTYPESGVIVMLPITRGRAKARMAHVMATRFALDANGIVSEERWTSLVRSKTGRSQR